MDETVLSVFFLFPFLFRVANCGIAQSSHLSPVKPLLDGATLISSGGKFELGFFSPGRSQNRYVGIWYHDFSPSTVLWVANRESPVPNTSGSLSISGDGNLVVLDGDGAVLWSSKAASFFSNSSTAELLDTGNFILKYSGSVLWQSFDHPTDTYLPGMKIGLDLTTYVNQVFTSWRSQNDPAPGKFTLGIAPDQSTQFFIWEDGKPRWRSGRWDGQVFIGIQGMVPTYIYGFKLSNLEQEKKMYFYYTAFNSSHRYVLMPDGVERHLVWENDTADWRQFWAQPVTQCELYNMCGDNAACSDGSPPACACLKGFERRSGGCMRRAQLQCEKKGIGEKDGFFLMTGVKLPDFSVWFAEPADWSQCEAACLRNCSCEAFSYVTGIGCLVWWRDLTDIRLFATGGNDFHLRLAASEFDDRKGLTAHIIVIIVFSALFSVGGFFFLYKCKSRIKDIYRKRIKQSKKFVDRSRSVGAPSVIGFSSVIDMQQHGKGENEVRLFSFQIIEEATMNFCSSNLLGEGGFGPVYKGILPMGEEIAVKRLSRSSGQGMEEFKNEVILIAKLQHRNLVRLLGYCIRREDKMLVYEYMPNKSLDALLLADPSRKLQLDWNMRYRIIEGIARGLIYLHRDSRLRIIHRDMKASNILLDENMNPKISDFGMARIFGNDANETSTKRVVGTYGYMSPEYAMHGLFSVKSDVYSFGVLILEIVSGIRNSTYYNSEVSLNLLGYAWKLWNEDNVMELVDSSIRSSCPIWEVSKCVNVGLLCIQDRANDRPTMSSVIVMLESENSVQPVPKKPKFAADMNRSETNSILHSAKSSITMLVGR